MLLLFFFSKPQVNPNCGLTCMQTATGYLDWISGLDRNIIKKRNLTLNAKHAAFIGNRYNEMTDVDHDMEKFPFLNLALANRFAINPAARDAVYK